MTRLPDPYKSLSDEHRAIFDSMEKKRGPIRGMYRTLFNHPELALAVSNLGTFIRFEGALSFREKEVAILTAARYLRAGFVWQQHERPALNAGAPQATIDGVKSGKGPPTTDECKFDILAWRVASLAMEGKSIPDDLAQEAKKRVGTNGLIEIVVVAGFYKMIACVVTAFDVPLPDRSSPPFDD